MGSLICEDSFLSVDGASPNAVWADSAPDGLLKWLPPEAPSHGQKRRILFGTSLALTKAPDSLHLVWKDCLPEETAEEAEDFDVVAHTEVSWEGEREAGTEIRMLPTMIHGPSGDPSDALASLVLGRDYC
eukprot:scaffold3581_cov252-Pinguiococcus_pyrenoidosus.AAC.19